MVLEREEVELSALPRLPQPCRDGRFHSISEHKYRHKHDKYSMAGTVMQSSIMKPHQPGSRGTIQMKAIS